MEELDADVPTTAVTDQDKERLKVLAAFFESYDEGYRVDPFKKIHWGKVHAWESEPRVVIHMVEHGGTFRWGAVTKALRVGHAIRDFSREAVNTAVEGDHECLAFAYTDDASLEELKDYLLGFKGMWLAHVNQENPKNHPIMKACGAKLVSARIGGVGAGEIHGIYYIGPRTNHTESRFARTCFARLPGFDPGDMAERLLKSDLHFDITNRGQRYGGPKKTWRRVCIQNAGMPHYGIDVGSTEALRNHPVFQVVPELLGVMEAVGPLHDYDYMMLTRTDAVDGIIARHSDIALDAKKVRLGPDHGKTMRLHFVLQSNPECVFNVWNVDGQKESVVMKAGEIWYTDVRKPHSVDNRGDKTRVHLVADFYGDTEPWTRFLETHPKPENTR